MDSQNKMKTEEEYKSSIKIKIEAPDFNSEGHCYEKLEIGEEFKTEYPAPKPVPQPTSTSSRRNNKLHYCTQCTRIWKHSELKDSKCPVCESTLSYKCQKCSKVCSSIKGLHDHWYRYCNKEPKFHCEQCDYKSYQKVHLTSHIRTNHLPLDPSLIKCGTCGQFHPRGVSNEHRKICGERRRSKRFHCDVCGYQSSTKSKLSHHMQSKHLPQDPNSNTCSRCGKRLAGSAGVKRHLKTCGKSTKPKLKNLCCDHCNYKTDMKSNLYAHVKSKHLPKDPNSNKCNRCGKSFSWPKGLEEHSEICGLRDSKILSGLKRFSCEHCGFKARLKSYMKSHMLARHLPKDPALYNCTKCGKNFSDRGSLPKHLKICGLPRQLQRLFCFHCDYETHRKSSLSKHMRDYHLPKLPAIMHKCKKCGSRYKNAQSFKLHQKICGKTKKAIRSLMLFSCDHCKYQSNYKQSICLHIQAKHSPWHTDKIECGKCGKSYSSRSGLRYHAKIC